MENLEASVLGTWKGDTAGDPFLEFSDAGKLSGSDGCNGVGGVYTVAGEQVTFDLNYSTLKDCPGVDDWLRDLAAVTVEGDTMTVMNADGDEIGQLQRSAAAAE